MTHDELQELMTEVVLGQADVGARAQLDALVEKDASAHAEWLIFQKAVEHLARVIPPVQPPAGLRTRLLETIRRTPQRTGSSVHGTIAKEEPPPRGFNIVRSDAVWRDGPFPGMRFKFLSAAPKVGYAMLMIEIAPGITYPEHDHDGPEELYVLTGDLRTEGKLLGPGDFIHAEPGSHHHELVSPHGCTALLVTSWSSVAGLAAAIG